MFECAVVRFSTHTELWMTGELDFSQEQRARAYWKDTQEFAPGAILLDISGLQFIDMAGFRLLTRFAQEAQAAGAGFVLMSGGNPRFHRPLDQLDRGRDHPPYLICFTRAEAFQALFPTDHLPLVNASATVCAHETGIIRWKFTRGKSILHTPSALAERFFGSPIPKRVPKPHPLVNWIHEEDRELVLAVHGQAECEGRCFTVEYRAISPRQELLWLCDIADGWKGDEEAAVRNIVTTEITQQKTQGRERQQHHAPLRTVINISPGSVLDLDADGRSHFVRALLPQLLDGSTRMSNGLPVLEFTEYPEQTDFTRRLLQILNGAEEHINIRLHRRDGQKFYKTLSIQPAALPTFEASKAPSQRPNPAPLTDASPKSPEAEFCQSLLVHISDGVFVMDKDGTLLEFNDAAEELSGYTRTQLLGKSFPQLLTPEDRDLFQTNIELTWAGESRLFEAKLQDAQARTVTLSITTAPILLHAQVIGVFGVLRDVTEQKRRELEYLEALTRERQARHQAEQAQRKLHLLAEASRIANDSSPPQAKLEQVAALALSVLGDACFVDVTDEARQLRRVAAYQTEPANQEPLSKWFTNTPATDPLPSAKAPDATPTFPELRYQPLTEPELTAPQLRWLSDSDTTPSFCVPIAGRDGPLGVLTFFRLETVDLYTVDDRELADELAQILATGIDRIFLYHVQRELTRTLQQSLLPPRLPDLPGVLIGTAYQPASAGLEIGGDFYDLFPISDGGWAAIIGDVTGKGPTAATVTGLVRHTLRALVTQIQEPSRLLAAANNLLVEQLSGEHFCAITFVHFSWQGEVLYARIASAGHLPTLVLRRNGELEILELPGMLLGVFPELTWDELTIAFEPGDTLILYTDGITDARAGRHRFGEEALQQLIRSCSGLTAQQIALRVETTVAQFCEGDPVDDIALLIVQLPYSPPPSPGS